MGYLLCGVGLGRKVCSLFYEGHCVVGSQIPAIGHHESGGSMLFCPIHCSWQRIALLFSYCFCTLIQKCGAHLGGCKIDLLVYYIAVAAM